MSAERIPEHIETVHEAQFFVWDVLEAEGLVDLRLRPVVNGRPVDADFDAIRTVSVDQFPETQHDHLLQCGTNLFDRQGIGLLHMLRVTYADGEQEDVETFSLRPYVPPAPLTEEQIAERDAWVSRIQSRAIRP